MQSSSYETKFRLTRKAIPLWKGQLSIRYWNLAVQLGNVSLTRPVRLIYLLFFDPA